MAKEHLEEGIPLNKLAKKYNYDITNLKYQCALYRKHGPSAFINDGIIKKYTRNEKLKAIKRNKAGESIRQIALDMGLSDASIIRDWVRLYDKNGEIGIKDTNSRAHYLLHEDRLDKIALDSMKDRMQYLEAENEYLKKSYSLILERSKQSKKK